MTAATIEFDPINPRHYVSDNGLEVIDIIEAYGLADSFHLANSLKYMLRAKSKGDYRENLLKAEWYLRRFHDRMNDDVTPVELNWPTSVEGVEEMMPIEAIVSEFKVEGSLAEAVTDLLNLCVAEDTEPLDQCLENLARAIKEAA